MCVAALCVGVCTIRNGNGVVRGTPMGRHRLCGSMVTSRVAMSAFAEGSNSASSSPGLSPPSRSMSLMGPPPTQTPLRSTVPSGNRGTGPVGGPRSR